MAEPGPSPPLPPGWAMEWNDENQRYFYIDTTTGQTSWDPPAPPPDAAAPAASGKRRQYAQGHNQAYYGGGDTYGSGTPQPQQQQAGGYGIPAQDAGTPGGQLFTPGLVSDQGGYVAPQQPAQGQYGGYPQGGGYNGAATPGYDQPQQQPAWGQQSSVDQLSGQFGGMGLGGGGQKPFSLQTVNLLATPPEPSELLRPPPEIRLPPHACVSNSPFANADPMYQRHTLNAVPNTASLLAKSKLPLGVVITPYPSLKPGEPEVPLVSDQVIARCRRCRTYINPYVQFVDGGNRWKCCMCGMANEIPQMFDWDPITNQPGDRWARPELNHAVVDFVAPTEYMVRPPPPYTLVVLIDVSSPAVQSGMVGTATRTILENLDRIPNADGRTKISIIAFDTALHFFSIPADGGDASMQVVADLEDIYLPKPTSDLLVNLSESRAAIEALLGRLPDMYADNTAVGSALGPALQAAYKMTSSTGGKVAVLSASLPTIGEGALKNREDPKVLGTPKESALLQPGASFYKTFAIECSRTQISIDMFLFGTQYQDVASLASLPKLTSGQTYFYPAFNAARTEDAVKVAHELGAVLAMPVGLEAVIRIRASKGLRMAAFHGNFFVRSTDLLAMPAFPQDQSYAIELAIEENLTAPFVVIQTGILFTTCFGERRVRVITSAVPVTQNMSEVFASADQIAMTTLFANKAVERTLSHKLEDARDALFNKVAEVLGAYHTSVTGAGGAGAQAQLAIADNLRMFPVLMLAILKTVGIRQSSQIPLDLRAYAQALLTSLPSELLIPYLYPTFYSLHDMPPEAGTIGEHGVILPPAQPLTSERLIRHGLFLLEDGQNMFLWVGRDAVPQLIQDVFDLPGYEALRAGKITMPELDNPFSQRVNAVIQKTRESRRGVYLPHLYVVKEDGEPALRLWALSCLIQDRSDALPSYQQFLQQVKDKVNGVGQY